MSSNPTILHYSYHDLDNKEIELLFLKYTKIKPDKTDRIYNFYAVPARNIMKKLCKLTVLYSYADIFEIRNDKISILKKDGSIDTICSAVMANAFSNAEKLLFYVASIVNEKDLYHISKDPITRYCMDYYGVAMLSAVRNVVMKLENITLSQTNKKLTTIWSPGQTGIDLAIQQTIFNRLHPETEGILLRKSLQMYPLHSASGIAGVHSADCTEKTVPCDYCRFALNCPGNCRPLIGKGGTAEWDEMQNRE